MKAQALAVAVFGMGACALSADGIRKTPLFPAEIYHNHASSIVETPEGDLLVCWYRGSGERDAPDVAVMGSRKRPGQDVWEKPFVMADTPALPDCNPVLFIDPNKTLWLFRATVQDNTWGGALIKVRRSRDYGADGPPIWQWEEVLHCRPEKMWKCWWPPLWRGGLLGQRLGWLPRAHPIMLPDNRLMLGLYSDRFTCSLAAFTSNWGQTWEFSEPIVGPGCIQPSFVRREDGSIIALMRDNGFFNRIIMSESADNGRTWSRAHATAVPNPGSAVECIPLKSGRWLMVCNDLSRGRWRLTAYFSDNAGASWCRGPEIERLSPEGQASYPSLMQARDGSIHCTYTLTDAVLRSTIQHAQFDESWVRGEPR